jgi:hypothetical protein
MKRSTSTPKKAPQFASAPAIHAPQLPYNLEQIRQRAEAFYAAHNGMIGMTLDDWLQAGRELKPKFKKQITNK